MRANIIYIAIPITIHEQQSYGGRFCPIDSRKPYQHNNNQWHKTIINVRTEQTEITNINAAIVFAVLSIEFLIKPAA